jgi:hypothetical protein
MSTPIQYEICVVSTTSRTYNFRVIDAPGQLRQFSVRIPSELFCPTLLKYQDGPPITFERLKQEIVCERHDAQAKPHLRIAETDINEYLERHYPRKKSKGRPC